jgi:predicted deacetylase
MLLASVHDVSPRFEAGVDWLIDCLRPYVGNRIALLAVPNHWGDAPIAPGSAFAARLRRWADEGMEIFLHGYYHRQDPTELSLPDRLRAGMMTAGEGEFLGLTAEAAVERIRAGREIIEDVTGRLISGFVAPAWLYGPGALDALASCGIAIAEDHWRVWSPKSGAELARGPVITWATRTPLRLASSLIAAAMLRRAPVRTMRIGVHPPDVRHPAVLRSIESTLGIASRDRQAGRYSDLLRDGRPRDFQNSTAAPASIGLEK